MPLHFAVGSAILPALSAGGRVLERQNIHTTVRMIPYEQSCTIGHIPTFSTGEYEKHWNWYETQHISEVQEAKRSA